MNVLLWVVQVLLALLSIGGGSYKVLAYEQFAKTPPAAALPHGGWIALGVFEIICGLLLIIPAFKMIPVAATALAIESIGLAVVYARYSTEFSAQNPLVWVIVMAVMAAFIAFGRFRTKPRPV
jgi:uncharacterized membrane protein YphA (DoxX/SURF4 family)